MVLDFFIDHEAPSNGWHSRKGHSQRGGENIGTNSNSHPHATIVRLRYHGHSNPTRVDCLLLSSGRTAGQQAFMLADWQEHHSTEPRQTGPWTRWAPCFWTGLIFLATQPSNCQQLSGELAWETGPGRRVSPRCRTPAKEPLTGARADS